MYSNSVLIICTTFNFPEELAKTLPCILNVLSHRDDTFCTIIDNCSKDKKTHDVLDSAVHDRLTVIKNKSNYGKAIATNAYLKDILSNKNCPRVLISMDPDVVFDEASFDYLISALDTIPKLGMLGMRYKNNGCNPERSVWRPAKTIHSNNMTFKIRCPLFANVAGPLFGIQGYALSHYLHFKLFPKSKNEENIKKGYVRRAGSDDAFLHDHFKKYHLIQGYLEGTTIEHLKAPPQTENYIQ